MTELQCPNDGCGGTLYRPQGSACHECTLCDEVLSPGETAILSLQARIAELETRLSGYHTDSACGACGGLLEDHRDAVCVRCSLENRIADLSLELQALFENVPEARAYLDNRVAELREENARLRQALAQDQDPGEPS